MLGVADPLEHSATKSAQPQATDDLARFHRQLQDHFERLRAGRPVDSPVFAIEHGMETNEVSTMAGLVDRRVRTGHSMHSTWLPLLVVAAEAGYEYDGGSYWPLLRARLPSWGLNDREMLRTYFRRFVAEYGAFEPAGPWADKFNIIAWPVSHAVLPRVFLSQLAEILYRLREELAVEEITEPARLGRIIETNALHASNRFREQASNVDVIGRIASALLTPDDAPTSTVLLPDTVERIAADLAEHSEARRWLDAARASSKTVFAGTRAPASGRTGADDKSTAAPGLDISLEEGRQGLRLVAEVPALKHFAESNDELRQFLMRGRVKFSGRRRPVHGRALLDSTKFDLDESPFRGAPFAEPESGSSAVRQCLNDVLRLPSPPWLFKMRDGHGQLIRSSVLRAGTQYAFVHNADLEPAFPWSTTTDEVAQLRCTRFGVPDVVDESTVQAAESAGLSLTSTIRVVPVGLPSKGWDDEDHAVWVNGHEVILKVDSDREFKLLRAQFGGSQLQIELEGPSTLLSLGCPPAGSHSLRLVLTDETGRSNEGTFNVRVTERGERAAGGRTGQAFQIMFDPPHPTFEELASGEVGIAIAGPQGHRARVSVVLQDRNGPLAAPQGNSRTLPLSSQDGRTLLNGVLRSEQLSSRVPRADTITIKVEHPEFGHRLVRIEREFEPLRWIYEHDGESLRLVDSVDDRRPEISFSPASDPINSLQVPLCDEDVYKPPAVGLFEARIGSAAAGIVTTPSRVSSFEDLGPGRPPTIERRPASVERIDELVSVARSWRMASKPLFTSHTTSRAVLRSIASAIARDVCGDRWAGVESAYLEHERWTENKSADAVGGGADGLSALYTLRRWFDAPHENRADLRSTFVGATGVFDLPQEGGVRASTPDFALILASEPSRATVFRAETRMILSQFLISKPVILRLARYVVLRLDQERSADLDTSEAHARVVPL